MGSACGIGTSETKENDGECKLDDKLCGKFAELSPYPITAEDVKAFLLLNDVIGLKKIDGTDIPMVIFPPDPEIDNSNSIKPIGDLTEAIKKVESNPVIYKILKQLEETRDDIKCLT